MVLGGRTRSALTRWARAAAAAALGASLVAVAPAGADPAILTHLSGATTTHSAGYPVPGTPAGRQLRSVTAEVEVYGIAAGDPSYFPKVDVSLAATPATDYDADARLMVGFGHVDASKACAVSHTRSTETSGRDGATYTIGGYTPDYWGGTPTTPWECLVVAVASLDSPGGQPVIHDAMVAELSGTYESPKVAIGEVSMYDGPTSTLRLVREVPTWVSVEVTNAGQQPSGPLTVTGSGKGLKVTSASVSDIGAESAATARLRVKVTGKKTGALTVRAQGQGIDVTRTLKVRAIAPPKPPRAGTYRSKAGDVTFRIRRGKVVGWSGQMQTRCGGYGDVPTYTTNTYDFPTTKIPRNGIVDASDGGTVSTGSWSSSLRLFARGSKVTHGLFRFGSPGPCTAVATFTAKRVGR